DGTFKDVTEGSGLGISGYCTGVAIGDVNNDGKPDVLVTQFGGVKLFLNQGDGKFLDVTEEAGLENRRWGTSASFVDFNGDGWPDIFIANDGKPNHLWINQKDGTFIEEALLRGVAVDSMGRAQAGMGVAVGDVDNNGLFDLFVTHLSEEYNTLWTQGP